MIGLFFSEKPITDLESAMASDTQRFNRFFHGMLDRGIYLPPSPFEAWFVSLAHTEKEIAKTIQLAGEIFREMAGD